MCGLSKKLRNLEWLNNQRNDLNKIVIKVASLSHHNEKEIKKLLSTSDTDYHLIQFANFGNIKPITAFNPFFISSHCNNVALLSVWDIVLYRFGVRPDVASCSKRLLGASHFCIEAVRRRYLVSRGLRQWRRYKKIHTYFYTYVHVHTNTGALSFYTILYL